MQEVQIHCRHRHHHRRLHRTAWHSCIRRLTFCFGRFCFVWLPAVVVGVGVLNNNSLFTVILSVKMEILWNGAILKWRCGKMVKWWNGEMVNCQNGEILKWCYGIILSGVSVSLSSLGSHCRRRNLVVGGGVSLLSLYCPRQWQCPSSWLLPSASAHRWRYCYQRFVVVIGVVMYSLAAMSLLLAAFVGFGASSPLSFSASCRRRRCIFVVVFVGFSLLLSASCCCRWRLVVVTTLSFSAAAYLLWLISSDFTPCRRCCRRRLVVVVVVGVLLSSLESR